MMNSERALRWCSAANNWEEFSGRVVSAAEKVDLSFLSGCRLQDIDETSTFIDWRYATSANKLTVICAFNFTDGSTLSGVKYHKGIHPV